MMSHDVAWCRIQGYIHNSVRHCSNLWRHSILDRMTCVDSKAGQKPSSHARYFISVSRAIPPTAVLETGFHCATQGVTVRCSTHQRVEVLTSECRSLPTA